MEPDKRLSPLSLLFEARHELRTHLALETALIELTAELPEDDFCHQAREALQLGAGYAYQRRETADDGELDHLVDAFFATQPRNRYQDTQDLQQRHLYPALLYRRYQRIVGELHPAIDPYTVEALAAFIDGFEITRDYFADQNHTSPTPAVESA